MIILFGMMWIAGASAAERTLKVADYTGRGFAPDLVQYTLLGGKADLKQLRLYSGANALVPLQISEQPDGTEVTLSFVAEIPPDGTATYTLRDGGGKQAPSGVRVVREAEALVLSNGRLSVRVPRETDKTFDPPVPAEALPAPILAFKSGKSDWLGSSKVLTKRKVKAMRINLVAEGPVYAEVRYEIDWAGGGYYRAHLRVIDRVPLVKVREEYDLGGLDGADFWELQLAEGWSPDRMEVAKTHGNGSGIDRGKVKPLADLAKMKNPRLTPDTCPPSLSQLGLFNELDRKNAPGGYAMAGIVPLHKGDWRKMNAVPIESTGPHDVRVLFPMSARHASWLVDTASETSPFSMIEHEPGLSRTYGRRLWGLVLGPPGVPNQERSTVRFSYFTAPQPLSSLGPFSQARSFYGVVGLDRYKDYILEWPDGNVRYPRLYQEPGTKARIEGPKGPTKYLDGLCNAPITCPVISHHLTVGTYTTAAQADATLARQDLPQEVRGEMRAKLALVMYLFEEADFIGYGNGAHSGNPNMGTSRYMGANAFLPLLADHPMFQKWRKHVSAYTEYKMASQIAPGGAYLEFGSSYHMHGYARTTNSLPGLISAGAKNVDLLYEKYHKPDWDYFMNLLTPVDARWRSRMVPGLANSGPGNVKHFMEAAGSFARQDPEFAAELVWAWRENGAKGPDNPAIVPGHIKPRPVALTSRIYPGLGVIFRAHQGPDETYMLLRSGFNWSHWTPGDPGHFFVLSRGATLVPYQPYAYWSSADRRAPHPAFDMHNVIRFGHPENVWPYGWPDCNILDHAFGPTVDYAWSSIGFPDWFISPGIAAPFRQSSDVSIPIGAYRKLAPGLQQKQGAIEWDRQVVFMKGRTGTSPNYFVLRDSVHGDGRLASYLYLDLLGREGNVAVKGGRVAVDTEWPTVMDVVFTHPETIRPDFYEERQPVNVHGTNLPGRLGKDTVASRNWTDKDGTPLKAGKVRGYEQHVFMRVPAAPGEGYFWVLYPRDRKEPAPSIKRLGPGVMKITHREGTDYAFVSPRHLQFANEDVIFAGSTGAVRVSKEAVTLALTGGAGWVGYKGYVIEGIAPLEKTIPLARLRDVTEKIAPPDNEVAWQPPADGLKQVARGVGQATQGQTIHFVIERKEPGAVSVGRNCFYARKAHVVVTPESIRFVVPEPTYAKLTVGNVGVRGVGPFDLTFTSQAITGTVAGRMRSLVTTWPEGIVRPMYHMDAVRYYAGWADDPSIGKGTPTPQFAIAFGVTDGAHKIAVGEWEYPELPPAPPRRNITF